MTVADVLIVGVGHAGLAAAYHVTRRGGNVLVVDRSARVGDVWRQRYDSLRLFTPIQICGLPGLPTRGDVDSFPTKDQLASYHERYAQWLGVPLRLGTEVLSAKVMDDRIVARTSEGEIVARHLIAATGLFGRPRIPSFSRAIAPSVAQMHVSAYHRPADVPPGTVVVVGSGNSGGDIAIELSASRDVVLSEGARRPAPPPWWRSVWAWRIACLRDRWTGGRGTPGGFGWPLRPGMFHVADFRRFERIRRVARMVGAEGDELRLEDGQRIRADVVIWATGYDAALDWIDAPEDPRVHVLSARFLFGLPHRAAAIGRKIEPSRRPSD